MHLRHWLALLPVLYAVVGVVLGNRVQPFLFGLPFFMAWVIGGVLLCAAVMAVVYRLDPANQGDPLDDVPTLPAEEHQP